MPWTSKKFLFLLFGSYEVTALLAKGEKEDVILGYRTRLVMKYGVFFRLSGPVILFLGLHS